MPQHTPEERRRRQRQQQRASQRQTGPRAPQPRMGGGQANQTPQAPAFPARGNQSRQEFSDDVRQQAALQRNLSQQQAEQAFAPQLSQAATQFNRARLSGDSAGDEEARREAIERIRNIRSSTAQGFTPAMAQNVRLGQQERRAGIGVTNAEAGRVELEGQARLAEGRGTRMGGRAALIEARNAPDIEAARNRTALEQARINREAQLQAPFLVGQGEQAFRQTDEGVERVTDAPPTPTEQIQQNLEAQEATLEGQQRLDQRRTEMAVEQGDEQFSSIGVDPVQEVAEIMEQNPDASPAQALAQVASQYQMDPGVLGQIVQRRGGLPQRRTVAGMPRLQEFATDVALGTAVPLFPSAREEVVSGDAPPVR